MSRGSMRGHWGLFKGKIVFLKDSWREWKSKPESEGGVLEYLHMNGVQNIPVLEYHGLVPERLPTEAAFERVTRSRSIALGNNLGYQCTQSDRFQTAKWACNGGRDIKVSSRRHYRLILGTVGYPLHTMSGTKELLHATYDVFQAIKDAHDKARMLHRDVSLANVVLVTESSDGPRRGYLVDWELAAMLDAYGEADNQLPLGTVPFMAQRLLAEAGNKVRQIIADDMESLLYVVMFCGLHWLPHRNIEDAQQADQGMFHNHMLQEPNTSRPDLPAEYVPMVQGLGKLKNKQDRSYVDPVHFEQPFQQWLEMAMSFNSPRRQSSPTESSEQDFKYPPDWVNPQPFYDFWTNFLETQKSAMPEHNKRMNLVSEEFEEPQVKLPVRTVLHKSGIYPNKRKAPQPRGPAYYMSNKRARIH
ncbi:hypothetical protein BKA93DRAFT_912292 [Sparassis latifolia]